MLEAVTQLTHFVERHEGGIRTDMAEQRLQKLVPRADVRLVTLERLLVWARLFLSAGRDLAEGLLPSYTHMCSLDVALPEGVYLHARPVSLIVGIVSHHGTPVELELAGQRSNAGSILELMVAVGSNAATRELTFHGDERPLRDLDILFQAACGEHGLDALPAELGYLKRG